MTPPVDSSPARLANVFVFVPQLFPLLSFPHSTATSACFNPVNGGAGLLNGNFVFVYALTTASEFSVPLPGLGGCDVGMLGAVR